jgi:hypothetical protein
VTIQPAFLDRDRSIVQDNMSDVIRKMPEGNTERRKKELKLVERGG